MSRSRAYGGPHPYRPLVALSAGHRIDVASIARSTAPALLLDRDHARKVRKVRAARVKRRRFLPRSSRVPGPRLLHRRVSTTAGGARSVRSLELLVLGPVDVCAVGNTARAVAS